MADRTEEDGARGEATRPMGGIDRTAVRLEIPSRRWILRIVGFCIAAEMVFVFLDLSVSRGGWIDIGAIRRLTSITRGDSLAFWFSATQALMVSLTLWLIHVTSVRKATAGGRSRGWLALALAFTAFTVYHGAHVHPLLLDVFERAFRREPDFGETMAWLGRPLDSFPLHTWQILALPFLGILALLAFLFLWRELERRRERLLVAGAACSLLLARVAALVQESALAESSSVFFDMLGVTTLWFAFMSHFARSSRELRLRFAGR